MKGEWKWCELKILDESRWSNILRNDLQWVPKQQLEVCRISACMRERTWWWETTWIGRRRSHTCPCCWLYEFLLQHVVGVSIWWTRCHACNALRWSLRVVLLLLLDPLCQRGCAGREFEGDIAPDIWGVHGAQAMRSHEDTQ